MAEFTGITFNENQMPDFVRVLGINHSILPPVTQNLLTIGGKAGAYDFGNVVGTREITVDIAVVAPEDNMLPSLLEQLSQWLYYDEPKELILGDNPYRYYLAKFTGDSEMAEQFTLGSGTLTFLCSDPYIYGQERSVAIPAGYTGQALELVNTGGADTFPKMSFEITKNLTNFSIVAGDEYLDFGTPYSVDDSADDIIDAGGFVAREKLDTTNGWTIPNSVYAGVIAGSFDVYGGYAFRQKDLNYGTGNTWHGASLQRAFTQDAQDFEANLMFKINAHSKVGYIGTIKLLTNLNMRSGASTKYRIKKVGKKGETYKVVSKASNGWYKLDNGYYCSNSKSYSTYTAETQDAGKMGRVLFTLREASGEPMVHAMIHDATKDQRSLQSEVYLVRGQGTVKHTIVKKNIPAKLHDMYGYYNIKRRRNIWDVSMYYREGDKWVKYYHVRWIDSKKSFSPKVTAIQVATLAYGTHPATYMELRDVWVKTLDKSVSSGKLPLIMRAGDVLDIDNATGAILLNDRPFYQYLNPSSTFIKLESGSNGLVISPADAFKNGSIEYVERTL